VLAVFGIVRLGLFGGSYWHLHVGGVSREKQGGPQAPQKACLCIEETEERGDGT